MPDISRITMPSGTTYDIKDSVARQMASGFRYTLSTDAATTPAGVQWKSGTTTITGTLVASSETVGIFYLVPSMKSAEGDKDIYDEYITIEKSAGVYDWEKIGNTQIDIGNLGDLAFKSSVALDKKTDVVLGEATTFTNGTSNVSFSGGTTASVIGANATFTVTQPTIGVTTEPTITVTPTTTNIKATASGTAVQVATSAAAITGITPSEDSVSAITSVDTLKMATTSITGTNGTVDVPNVTNVGSAPTLGTAFKSNHQALAQQFLLMILLHGVPVLLQTGALRLLVKH